MVLLGIVFLSVSLLFQKQSPTNPTLFNLVRDVKQVHL